MIQKRPLDPRRLRSHPPRGFGWLDHRLLRQGYLARCSPPATALYCLLVCAGDGCGLSFYSDPRICVLLGLEPALLPRVRRELVELGLVAYQKPLYQVLALGDDAPLCHRAPQPAPPAPAHSRKLCPPPERPAPVPVPVAGTGAGGSLRAMVEAALAAARTGGAA
jgi:hypothetical protein